MSVELFAAHGTSTLATLFGSVIAPQLQPPSKNLGASLMAGKLAEEGLVLEGNYICFDDGIAP